MTTRVLYFSHGHPAYDRGGAEQYAWELYRGVRAAEGFEPVLVCRVGPSGPRHSENKLPHPGTRFASAEGDPNQVFIHIQMEEFDRFHLTIGTKDFYRDWIDPILEGYPPDVVHIQHTVFFGIDLVWYLRSRWPLVPIVYTLHEFYPICFNEGQLLRTAIAGRERCLAATPRRCHECFPEVSTQAFHLRTRLIQTQLDGVDRFIAPSRFLAERFIDWGIPREKMIVEEYGRLIEAAPEAVEAADGPRARFGFFGQLNQYKGWDVLLRAEAQLSASGPPPGFSLQLFGANRERQPYDVQANLTALLDAAGPAVRFEGPYKPGQAVGLMRDVDWIVVPSIWWENSPLVIQEAFAAGRPVICSDIGGMKEKVDHEVNGLHFRAGDPAHLAAMLRRAATEPGLWNRLRAGIPKPYAMSEHVTRLTDVYRELIAERGAP